MVFYGSNAERIELDADTHIDVFRQKLVRNLVLLQSVIEYADACERGSDEESE